MLREISIHGTNDEQLSEGGLLLASALQTSFGALVIPYPWATHFRPTLECASFPNVADGSRDARGGRQCTGLTGMRVLIQICFSYFLVDTAGMVVTSQEGVFRSNCMDCLDRTNVIQSLLARRSLQAQLQVHALCLSY